MAQIWLTDREIAALFGLSPHAAYDQALEANWPFRRSSDGQMRFKVSDGAAHLFMIRYARQYLEMDVPEVDAAGEAIAASGRSAVAAAEPQDAEGQPDNAAAESAVGAAALGRGRPPVEAAAFPDDQRAEPGPVAEEGPAQAPASLPRDVAVEVPTAAPALASNGAGSNLADADYWAGIFQRAFEERMGRGPNGAPH
jgi:hypothetical protein